MKLRLTLIVFTSLLLACGGCSDNKQDSTTPPPTNILPIADAGDGVDTEEESAVTLIGSGTDPDGSVVSYSWQQVSGTNVQLTTTNEPSLSFIIPNLPTDEILSFELTVTDNSGDSHSDIATVNVKHIPWFLTKTYVTDISGDNLVDLLLIYENSYYEMQQKRSRITYRKNLGSGNFSNEFLIDRNITEDVHFAKTINLNGQSTPDLVLATDESLWGYNDVATQLLPERKVLSKGWAISDIFDTSISPSPIVLPIRKSCRCLLTPFNNIPASLHVADITGNGLDDLVWLSYASEVGSEVNQYLLYRAINNGAGDFSAPELIQTATDRDRYLQSEIDLKMPTDINNDGTKDIVYSLVDHLSGAIEQRWFLGNEQVSHSQLVSFPTTNYPIDSKLIDWNEDGNIDVISWFDVVSFSILYNHVRLYTNIGQANFSGEQELADMFKGLYYLTYSELTDIDSDGYQDLITYLSKSVNWQKKRVNKVEPIAKLFEYKGNMNGAFDLNHDGKIDFVSNFGDILYWYKNKGNLVFEEIEINIVK